MKYASAFLVRNKNCMLVIRLQVFHCLHHDGEGGETVLVDGFRAAYDLKERHPESFKRLSTLPIEAEYLEAGKHYVNVDSILKLHPLTKKLQQIRYRSHSI
jgi:alpha-ketoglutarate-dependent taurine dioxygenase